jgi:ribosomal protein L29
MSSHLAYGNNTIIVRGKAKKKLTLKEIVDRGNNRFTNKAVDKFGNEVVNITGSPVEYVDPAYEGNVGDRIIYPAANITTADVAEQELKKQSIMQQSSLKIAKKLSRVVQQNRDILDKYALDNPDVHMEFLSKRERENILKEGRKGLVKYRHEKIMKQMTDQGPSSSTHIYEMREDVPHREGLKTTGLTSQELADLKLSEEEMKAVGGEDVPMTEEEKGALKTSGLAKKELQDTGPKRITITNINKNFDILVDEAKDLSYEKKLERYEFIEDKLTNRYKKLLEKYKDYIKDNKFVNDIPIDVYNELRTTYENGEKIRRDIARHKTLSPKKENIIV